MSFKKFCTNAVLQILYNRSQFRCLMHKKFLCNTGTLQDDNNYENAQMRTETKFIACSMGYYTTTDDWLGRIISAA